MERLRTILFSIGLTLVCGTYGVWGVLQRVQWAEPVSVQCDAREVAGHRRVRVSLCEYKPALVKRGDDGTWLTVEHLNGLGAVPMLVHTQRADFIDASTPGLLLAPFYAEVVDVPAGFPDMTVALEESPRAPLPPSLIWPIVSLVAALFWLVMTVSTLVPRKKKGEPDSSSPSVSTN